MEKNARCTSLTDPPYSYMLNNSIYVVWLLIAVLCACIWPSRLLSSTLPSSLSMVPRYRTFTPRWWSAEVRLAPSIGTAVWSRQSINYNRNDTHTSSYTLCDTLKHYHSTHNWPLLGSDAIGEKQLPPTAGTFASEPPLNTQQGIEHLQERHTVHL